MSSDAPVIEAVGVAKRYDVFARPADRLRQFVAQPLRRALGLPPGTYARPFWALHPTSFRLAPRESVAIIGRNGSGKSTLLQMVCGTLPPTQGQVHTRGRIAALLELGAGFNPEFTGEENIRLSALLYGIPAAELDRRFESIVGFSELGDFIGQPVKTYSSGMYVRLAFSIAAHVDADLLVVDEALSVGDVRFQQRCARYLREFRERGTLLFVSHDMSAVVNLCSRALWLDEGRLRRDGPAKEVVEAYLAEQHAKDREAAGARVTVRAPLAAAAQGALRPAEAAVAPPSEAAPHAQAPQGPAPHGQARFASFDFDPQQPHEEFGERRIRICAARLVDDESGRAIAIAAGNVVRLEITASADEPVERLIFGFYVKDRLGQRLFGDNSYFAVPPHTLSAQAGESLVASFRFQMPMMPSGAYTIDVALATGTHDDHTQQHWVHDAVVFRCTDTTMRFGLVGIPMLDIQVRHTQDAT